MKNTTNRDKHEKFGPGPYGLKLGSGCLDKNWQTFLID